MEYRPAHELVGTPHVLVDGGPQEGTVLTLSHWPGSGTPPDLLADLSTEIAFGYLARPDVHVDVDLVTNDHLDVDGFCAVFVLTRPDVALARQDLVVEVAAAGDFACRCSDRAADVCFAIGALRDPAATDLPPDALVGPLPRVVGRQYELLLPRLVDLLDDTAAFERLWGPERATLEHAEAAFKAGDLVLEEHAEADLAVVHLPPGWPGGGVQRGVLQRDTPVHPMAVHRRTTCWRVAYVSDSTRQHRLIQRFESWAQLTSRRAGRPDLRPLAAALDVADTDPGWIVGGKRDHLPWLRRRHADASALDARTFAAVCAEHLAAAPIVWTPYA